MFFVGRDDTSLFYMLITTTTNSTCGNHVVWNHHHLASTQTSTSTSNTHTHTHVRENESNRQCLLRQAQNQNQRVKTTDLIPSHQLGPTHLHLREFEFVHCSRLVSSCWRIPIVRVITFVHFSELLEVICDCCCCCCCDW